MTTKHLSIKLTIPWEYAIIRIKQSSNNQRWNSVSSCPEYIWLVLGFENRCSFEAHKRSLCRENPHTPKPKQGITGGKGLCWGKNGDWTHFNFGLHYKNMPVWSILPGNDMLIEKFTPIPSNHFHFYGCNKVGNESYMNHIRYSYCKIVIIIWNMYCIVSYRSVTLKPRICLIRFYRIIVLLNKRAIEHN